MTTTAEPLPTTTTTPAPTPAPLAPVKRQGPGWGSEFAARLIGKSSAPAAVAGAPLATVTHGMALKRAAGDAVTVGITGSLLGAANAKGWLDFGRVAVDGVLALFGLATSVAAAPYWPGVSRVANNVALTSLATLSFRKAEGVMGGGQKTTTAPTNTAPPAHAGEDRIADVAHKLDLL